MSLLLAFLALSFASALEPNGWERRSLEGASVSILVPKGSVPQRSGRRHPGFDESAEGWQLQSVYSSKKGVSRMILYMRRGDITVYYSKNNADRKLRTLDGFVAKEANGRKPEAEEYGKWNGYTVRLIALKDPDRQPAPDAPFGDLAIHAVDLGPTEYLAVTLHANPNAIESYLPYFYKVRDSISYKKPLRALAKVQRPAQRSRQGNVFAPRRRLVLLPHIGSERVGRGFYPYIRVFQCPQGTIPTPSNWPMPGDILCQPIRPYSSP